MHGSVRGVLGGLCAVTALALAAPAAHAQGGTWSPVSGPPATSASGAPAEIQASSMRAYRLDEASLAGKLRSAPKIGLKSRSLAASSNTIITLPAPDGSFQRFQVEESPIMEAGLAARHPEIKTYAGVGLDDPNATLRADTTPLGFHASVRSPSGAWYVDPYYHLDDSVYVSYFGHDLENAHGAFKESEIEAKADPLDLGLAAAATPEIQLRTYRLALVTDPSYATYFGGPANVTAAKVTLMNRVDQIYEDETAIRMILINDTDKLNLDTDALATGANGPCGSAPCFTTQQLSTCGSSTLSRNRIVIGQIIGASNYDVGHIGLGKDGGGVASLGVVGGNSKAQGCTGLPTPVGDFYAVDYVAHEMGHQFAGNHTFNGTLVNCSTGNRNPGTSVEPGSGSSIMAYAGICGQDNLQPHSDPYWSQRSFSEITTYTSSTRNPISEVQNVSLRDFDGSDSVTLRNGAQTAGPFVRGANYTQLDIQGALQGNEVQAIALSGFDDGDSFTITYHGVSTVPLVRGQNYTVPGIQNAIQGGNEQQQVTLAGFDPSVQSFRISLNGTTSALIGAGGLAYSNNGIATAINGIAGFAGGAAVSGTSATGFLVTFSGASARIDVPALSIVQCTGACTSAVQEVAKGGVAISSWPAGATVTAGNALDSGFQLYFGGTFDHQDVDSVSITNGTGGTTGTVTQSTAAGPGIFPAGTTIAVAPFGNAAPFNDTGFQITYGGTLANLDLPPIGLTVTGGTGFVGETAKGGPIQNQGYFVLPTANHAPDVTVPAGYTIPTRTPFSLTGSATDPEGEAVTYMWEQNDAGTNSITGGTSLVSNTKTNGPLFRQFGTYANVSPTDTLKTPSPGENMVDRNPTRVFPDMPQIMIDNTNAATGSCPAPPATGAVPIPTVDCFSEFLPTSDWVGVLGNRQLTFRLTARDGHVGGGGVGNAETKLTVAPLAGPFRVTSQSIPQSIYGTAQARITWDVAGTDQPPVNVANVKISLSTDNGATWPYVLAASTPNDGSADVFMPNIVADKARVKVEAVGNVFFDVNHTDFKLVAPPTGTVTGTVPATLALTLGGPASFGAFTAGLTKDYDANIAANVISTAGDATLSVADASANVPGHLVNGAFSLPSALLAKANAGAFGTVGSAPANLLTYSGPVSNDAVAIGLRQHIDANDALRTGTYSKTLTFTLSTTTP